MKLIITVDTEEDNWGSFVPTGHTVRNIEQILDLHRLFMEFKVRPTYLVSYPVITNERSATIMREIFKTGVCEIGTHCHPWNTPPFEEETNEKNSMLCNLSADLQYKKLSVIHSSIIENLGIEPVSFRAGRWGFDQQTAEILQMMNYRVDSSVTPYVSWAKFFGPDFSSFSSRPFWFAREDATYSMSSNELGLLEVPASFGFLQMRAEMLARRADAFVRMKYLRHFRLTGLLDKIGLLNKVSLCPEVYGTNDMIRLSKVMRKTNHDPLNLFFHSTSLVEGAKSIGRSLHTAGPFLDRVKDFLIFVRDLGIDPMTLSEYYDYSRDANSKYPVFTVIPLSVKRKNRRTFL